MGNEQGSLLDLIGQYEKTGEIPNSKKKAETRGKPQRPIEPQPQAQTSPQVEPKAETQALTPPEPTTTPEPAVKPPAKPKKRTDGIIIDERESEDENPQLNQIRAETTARQENFAYCFVSYLHIENKEGLFKKGVSSYHGEKREFRAENESGGGGWGGGQELTIGKLQKSVDDATIIEKAITPEQAQEFYTSTLNFKRRIYLQGYCNLRELKLGGSWLTDIHWDNCYLVITDKAGAFLKEYLDIDKLQAEWNAIIGHPATEPELARVRRAEELDDKKDELRDLVHELEKVLRQRIGLQPGYSGKPLKEDGEFAQYFKMSIDELVVFKIHKQQEFVAVEQERDALYNKLRETDGVAQRVEEYIGK